MSAPGTPGPWEVSVQGELVIAYPGGDATVIADLIPANHRTALESEANATLMAAAPDLYEALEAYEARIGDADMGSDYLTSLVVAALAKARGDA